eukprot:353436-Chlamydomonas_euryale.AAC.5
MAPHFHSCITAGAPPIHTHSYAPGCLRVCKAASACMLLVLSWGTTPRCHTARTARLPPPLPPPQKNASLHRHTLPCYHAKRTTITHALNSVPGVVPPAQITRVLHGQADMALRNMHAVYA